jgi:hypothetical protein
VIEGRPPHAATGAGSEQRAEERHLRLWRRVNRSLVPGGLEEAGLHGPRRRGLLWADLQQSQQPGILGLQPRQFGRDLLGISVTLTSYARPVTD